MGTVSRLHTMQQLRSMEIAMTVGTPWPNQYSTSHKTLFFAHLGDVLRPDFGLAPSVRGGTYAHTYSNRPFSFVGNNTPSFTVPPNLDTFQDPPSGENFTSQAMDQGEMPFDGGAWM